MLNRTQIENNINWILNNASPAVKYLTYKNILNADSSIPSELFRKIEKSDIVKDIFSKQKIDGSWCSSGIWAAKPAMRKSGYTPVSPKYVTTSWILPILGNSGYNFEDERIRKACEYILSYQLENGYIDEIKPDELKPNYDMYKNEPCRFSIILTALGKVGAIEDSRVKKAFDLLIEWQRSDGGWVSENHSNQKKWTRSCPFSSYHSALALYSSGKNIYEKQLKNALEFLSGHLSAKSDSEIQRFFYHGHSLIHELLMFTELKVGLGTGTINRLLEWLASMYQSDKPYFKNSGKPITGYSLKNDYMDSKVAKYRLFQLIEDDWLTYYATRIFNNLLEND